MRERVLADRGAVCRVRVRADSRLCIREPRLGQFSNGGLGARWRVTRHTAQRSNLAEHLLLGCAAKTDADAFAVGVVASRESAAPGPVGVLVCGAFVLAAALLGHHLPLLSRITTRPITRTPLFSSYSFGNHFGFSDTSRTVLASTICTVFT